ncbi:MAG: beta-ketoacyl-[acyl-carrier-protein] synthase II, partial [Anaerolineales bacterium]|nr:beta-ketoacyl-[acyl-carrier-protein] synthase II [Anaerolineales bacterium]
MSTKVVITGLGCVSPLGNDVASTWENLVAGRSGVGRVTRFDVSGFKSQLAAEVKDFDAEQLFGRKAARRMDRVSQYALAAAGQALAQSALTITDQNRARVGALVGSGIGGMGTLIDGLQILAERGPERVSPFTVPM